MAHPPHWASPAVRFVTGSPAGHTVQPRHVFATIQIAALYLRERMHTTWLFCGVFAAVWLACLLWMHFGRRGRGLAFDRQEALWIGGSTLLVFFVAALYGLGTKGVIPQRIPALVPVSDAFAIGFMLALPVITLSRIRRRHEEEIEAEFLQESSDLSARSLARLGLSDDQTILPLAESPSRLDVRLEARRDVRPDEIKPMDLFPSVQTSDPDEHANATGKRVVEDIEMPVPLDSAVPILMTSPALEMMPQAPNAGTPAEREPDSIVSPEPEPSSPAGMPVAHAGASQAARGMNGFHHDLSTLYQSWQRIETMRGEIDEWFEKRRQLAVAHIGTPPAVRNSGLARGLVQDFPDEKVVAIEAEWAEIRSVALEISRSVGDVPAPDHRS